MKTTRIGYVSDQPGAGKTRAAISMMIEHITLGKPGAIFYCAPNHYLIAQTLNNLGTVLDDESLQRKKIVHVIPENATAYPHVGHLCVTLRGTAGEQIAQILASNMNGRVFMITHPAFLDIGAHPALANVTVLFDESNTCVSQPEGIKFDRAMQNLTDKMFEMEPLYSDESDTSKVCRIYPKPVIGEYSKLLKRGDTNVPDRGFRAVTKLHKRLLPDDSGVHRVMSYCILKSSSSGIKSLVVVTLPHPSFVGYKSVIILCANFQTSQMYHFLKRYRVQCQNITREFMTRFLGAAEYYSISESVIKRYKKLMLAYLIDDEDAMPSSHMMDRGILVEPGTAEAYTDYARQARYGSSAAPPSTVIAGANGKSQTVYRWLEEQAGALARRWQKTHGKPGDPLIFYNHSRSQDEHHDRLFQYVNHGNIIGSNKYMDRNVVAFLASSNPDPDVRIILNELLGDSSYDCDEDHTVVKAVQCIGRGNVRDQESDEKMLAIFPTRKLALAVQKMLGGYPTVPSSLPPGVQPVELVRLVRANGNRKGTNHRRKSWTSMLTEEQYKYNRSLSARISKERKAIREGKCDLDVGNAKIAELQQEIAELKKGVVK